MTQSFLLSLLRDSVGRVLLPASCDSAGRSISLEEIQGSAPPDSLMVHVLRCGLDEGGPWAGVNDLFRSLLPTIRTEFPALLEKHDYELVHVMPELRSRLSLRNPCLTDVAKSEERVRNYPADRAYRIVHGLIDLLAGFKVSTDPRTWVLICTGYDEVGHMAHCFFRELMRRRGTQLGLLMIPVSSAAGELCADFEPPPHRLDFAVSVPVSGPETSAIEAASRAEAIEAKVSTDMLESTLYIPELIRLWRIAGNREKQLRWGYEALKSFNTLGFYRDAIRYGETARRLYLECRGPARTPLLWGMFFKLSMSYLGTSDVDAVLRLAEEDVLTDSGDPEEARMRVSLYYLIAMLHARYIPNRDLGKGEKYLAKGLVDLEQLRASDEYWFLFVFNRNGLAMIRNFQGRYDEALELCREGYELLERHLDPGCHRLHRSVLLYNMAQVLSQMRLYERAVEYYSSAMEMDPNYSEYYNERGNLFVKLGRLEEALSDYLRSIELSPPFFEVWTNLGHCLRTMGRMGEAVAAYTRTLDLQPRQPVALLGRAQALEAASRTVEAIADYSAALEMDASLWQAAAGRAVLLYEAGRVHESLLDLNRAIAEAPGEADLYENRAVALADLERYEDAHRDLLEYLALRPELQGSSEVQARLKSLALATASPGA